MLASPARPLSLGSGARSPPRGWRGREQTALTVQLKYNMFDLRLNSKLLTSQTVLRAANGRTTTPTSEGFLLYRSLQQHRFAPCGEGDKDRASGPEGWADGPSSQGAEAICIKASVTTIEMVTLREATSPSPASPLISADRWRSTRSLSIREPAAPNHDVLRANVQLACGESNSRRLSVSCCRFHEE